MTQKVTSLWANLSTREVRWRIRLNVQPEFKELAVTIFIENELSFEEIEILFNALAESCGLFTTSLNQVKRLRELLSSFRHMGLEDAQAQVNKLLVDSESEERGDLGSWLGPFFQLTTRESPDKKGNKLLGLYFCIIYAALCRELPLQQELY